MNAGHTRGHEAEQTLLSTLLLVCGLLGALFLLFLLPLNIVFVFWAGLALTILLFATWAIRRRQINSLMEPDIRALMPYEQPPVLQEIMEVQVATEEDGVQVYRGPLRQPAVQAYEKLKAALHFGFISLLQKDERLGAAVMLVPRTSETIAAQKRASTWPNWILFFVTFLTTTWVGAAYQGVDLWKTPASFATGLPYSFGLLAILGVHEFGHYIAARLHGIHVTPPYFIPVPFGLGTFGAFIRMRSPSENRKALFDVAVAGPLAGLVVALPALLIGLRLSNVTELPGPFIGTPVNSSILFAIMAKLSLGDMIQATDWVRLSPLAFAGWLGLFITALNLIPVGQLDGGHAMRAMFGHRIGTLIGGMVMWSMFLLALFVWPGLMLWVLIVFILARRASPPLNDLTPISRGRKWLGAFCFAILAMILLPVPPGWLTAIIGSTTF